MFLRDAQCCKLGKIPLALLTIWKKASQNVTDSHRNCIRWTWIIVGAVWLPAEWSEAQEQAKREREVPEDPRSLTWPAELATAQETVS